MFKDDNFILPSNVGDKILNGRSGSLGEVEGFVYIVQSSPLVNFNDGDILVCSIITVDLLPFIKRAGAVVTEQGSLFSHATIITRELKKPLIVGVHNATSILKSGSFVKVDASRGVIKEIK